jgi:hypothetical protein
MATLGDGSCAATMRPRRTATTPVDCGRWEILFSCVGRFEAQEVGLPRAVVAMPRGKERSGSVEVLGTKWHDVHVLDQ